MKLAVEQVVADLPVATPFTSDHTKISFGPGCGVFTSPSGEKFVGPTPTGVGYLAENFFAGTMLCTVKWQEDEHWVFTAEAGNRRVQFWRYKPSNQAYSYEGTITLTLPSATGSHTTKGFNVCVKEQSTAGTVAVSGTTVTGTGTNFTTGFSAGSWIQFGPKGNNNPYYEIASINSATSITLVSGVPTAIAAGSACRIIDMMVLMVTTNTTTTAGGLFVCKGLNPDVFTLPATNTIPAATTVDKVRAVYWLRDAATNTQVAAIGCAVADVSGDTMVSQFVYVGEATASTLKMYKYNFRTPISPTSGSAVLVSPNVVITGTQSSTTNMLLTTNGRVANLSHGPGSGVDCLYMGTVNRVLRIPLSSVTSGSTTFIADSMAETPPGTTTTNLSVNSYAHVDVSTYIDRIIIVGQANSGTLYCTQYNTTGAQFERRFSSCTFTYNSQQRDNSSPAYQHQVNILTPVVWCGIDVMFSMNSTSSTVLANQIISQPLTDFLYQTTSAPSSITAIVRMPMITLPATTLLNRVVRVVVNASSNEGGDTEGIPTEGFKTFYRTSGITDDSGAWTLVPASGILNVPTVSNIQFGFTFRTLGIGNPVRINSLVMLYEADPDLPSFHKWYNPDMDAGNYIFAWQQQIYGPTNGTPTYQIAYIRKDTGAIVFSQSSSVTTNGRFQYWNGSSWVNAVGPNQPGVRRRFVPNATGIAAIPAGVGVYCYIRH